MNPATLFVYVSPCHTISAQPTSAVLPVLPVLRQFQSSECNQSSWITLIAERTSWTSTRLCSQYWNQVWSGEVSSGPPLGQMPRTLRCEVSDPGLADTLVPASGSVLSPEVWLSCQVVLPGHVRFPGRAHSLRRWLNSRVSFRQKCQQSAYVCEEAAKEILESITSTYEGISQNCNTYISLIILLLFVETCGAGYFTSCCFCSK